MYMVSGTEDSEYLGKFLSTEYTASINYKEDCPYLDSLYSEKYKRERLLFELNREIMQEVKKNLNISELDNSQFSRKMDRYATSHFGGEDIPKEFDLSE